MRWDYRIVRRTVEGEERLGIHRAFYADGNEHPQAVTLAPCPVEGPDPAELLRLMAQALDKPVVEFSSLENQSLLAGFLAAEDRRLLVGLMRKADGMDQYLAGLKDEDAELPPGWPNEDPPDMADGSYIAFVRKRPQADFLVEFPDLPGCQAFGHSLEQARSLAQEALTRHMAGETPPPKARGWDELSSSPDRKGATLIVVAPYPEASHP